MLWCMVNLILSYLFPLLVFHPFFYWKFRKIHEKDVAVCPKFCLPILVGLSLGNFLQFVAKWLGFMVGKLQIQNQDEKLVWLDVSIVSIGQFWTKSLGSWAQLKIQIAKSQIFVNAQTFGGLIWKESNLLWNFNLIAWVKC